MPCLIYKSYCFKGKKSIKPNADWLEVTFEEAEKKFKKKKTFVL